MACLDIRSSFHCDYAPSDTCRIREVLAPLAFDDGMEKDRVTFIRSNRFFCRATVAISSQNDVSLTLSPMPGSWICIVLNVEGLRCKRVRPERIGALAFLDSRDRFCVDTIWGFGDTTSYHGSHQKSLCIAHKFITYEFTILCSPPEWAGFC